MAASVKAVVSGAGRLGGPEVSKESLDQRVNGLYTLTVKCSNCDGPVYRKSKARPPRPGEALFCKRFCHDAFWNKRKKAHAAVEAKASAKTEDVRLPALQAGSSNTTSSQRYRRFAPIVLCDTDVIDIGPPRSETRRLTSLGRISLTTEQPRQAEKRFDEQGGTGDFVCG